MKKLIQKLSAIVKRSKLAKPLSNELGQGMIEYILIVAIIVIAIFALKPFFTEQVDSIKGQIGSSIQGILGN